MADEPKHTGSTHASAAAAPASERASAAKQQVNEARESSAKQVAERLKGRPTPTQEEIDQIASGHHVDLSDDGSGPDPVEKLNTTRTLGGEHRYQHRQMNPKS
jgi:hypothetical protein